MKILHFYKRSLPQSYGGVEIFIDTLCKTISKYDVKDGLNIRDWFYVEDHCSALIEILDRGRPGQTYIIGAENEKNNNETVEIICGILDEIKPIPKIEKIKNYNELIVYVNDRPCHDRRYAVNPSKIKNELNWIPKETFFTGLKKTVTWYLSNQNWVKNIDINL